MRLCDFMWWFKGLPKLPLGVVIERILKIFKNLNFLHVVVAVLSGYKCFFIRLSRVFCSFLFILVCMHRGDPYLSVDIKIKFIRGSIWKIYEALQQPSLVGCVPKNRLVREWLSKVGTMSYVSNIAWEKTQFCCQNTGLNVWLDELHFSGLRLSDCDRVLDYG